MSKPQASYQPLTRFEKVISYLVLFFSALLSFVLFFVLNRTHVHGWRHFPRRRGTLLLSNHRTMIDSFLVGLVGCFPHGFLRPSLMAYHTAAGENFFSNPVLAWFSRMWRCLPVKPGRIDPTVLRTTAEILPETMVIMFPEGTRSRDGAIGKGRLGVGKIIQESRPTVVPVFVAGMDKVLPLGAKIPRILCRIDIYFSRPLDLSSYLQHDKGRETTQAIVDRVIDEIRLLEKIHHSRRSLSWTRNLLPRAVLLGCWALEVAGLLLALPFRLARSIVLGILG